MNVPVPNANMALWIDVARTSGSSESTRSRSLRSRPGSAVMGCCPLMSVLVHRTQYRAAPLIAIGYFGRHRGAINTLGTTGHVRWAARLSREQLVLAGKSGRHEWRQ